MPCRRMTMVFSAGMLWPQRLAVAPEVVISMLPVLNGLRGAELLFASPVSEVLWD